MVEKSIIPCCPYTYTEALIDTLCFEIEKQEKLSKKNNYYYNNYCCCECLCFPCTISVDIIIFPFYILNCTEEKKTYQITPL